MQELDAYCIFRINNKQHNMISSLYTQCLQIYTYENIKYMIKQEKGYIKSKDTKIYITWNTKQNSQYTMINK